MQTHVAVAGLYYPLRVDSLAISGFKAHDHELFSRFLHIPALFILRQICLCRITYPEPARRPAPKIYFSFGGAKHQRSVLFVAAPCPDPGE